MPGYHTENGISYGIWDQKYNEYTAVWGNGVHCGSMTRHYDETRGEHYWHVGAHIFGRSLDQRYSGYYEASRGIADWFEAMPIPANRIEVLNDAGTVVRRGTVARDEESGEVVVVSDSHLTSSLQDAIVAACGHCDTITIMPEAQR